MKRDRLLQELTELHRTKRTAIRRRLKDFASIPASEYFYELLYCLLTPQTSAVNADKTIAKLKEVRFEARNLNPEPFLADKRHYIRFHKTKSKHLLKLKAEIQTVQSVLSNDASSNELREWLVKNIYGLGYKEATHFLRNIGKNDGLAILDRHILRNLQRYGAIRSLPETLSRKQYLSIEKKFMSFAQQINIPIDELDLLFWSMETGEIRK